jgi:hypothetical protein
MEAVFQSLGLRFDAFILSVPTIDHLQEIESIPATALDAKSKVKL